MNAIFPERKRIEQLTVCDVKDKVFSVLWVGYFKVTLKSKSNVITILQCAAMKSFQKHIVTSSSAAFEIWFMTPRLFSLEDPIEVWPLDPWPSPTAQAGAPARSKWRHWPRAGKVILGPTTARRRLEPRRAEGVNSSTRTRSTPPPEPRRAERVNSSARTTLPGDMVGTASHKLSMSECVCTLAWHVCRRCVSHCEFARDIQYVIAVHPQTGNPMNLL